MVWLNCKVNLEKVNGPTQQQSWSWESKWSNAAAKLIQRKWIINLNYKVDPKKMVWLNCEVDMEKVNGLNQLQSWSRGSEDFVSTVKLIQEKWNGLFQLQSWFSESEIIWLNRKVDMEEVNGLTQLQSWYRESERPVSTAKLIRRKWRSALIAKLILRK